MSLWRITVRAKSKDELESFHFRVCFNCGPNIQTDGKTYSIYEVDEEDGCEPGDYFVHAAHMRAAMPTCGIRIDGCEKIGDRQRGLFDEPESE